MREQWGTWLDARLPWPRPRAAAREWRGRRPFWAGLLLMASGAELMIAPLSPFGVLVSLGIGGIAAIAIGLGLILAGVFLWAAPHARAYVSLNALLLSVLSFMATNLGGFVVGTLMGIAGSAMGFGWTPEPKSDEPGPGEPAPADRELAGDDADSTAAQRAVEGKSSALRRTHAVVLPLALVAALLGATAPEAQARSASANPPRSAVAAAVITTSRFTPEGFAFAGTEEVPTADGPMKVIVLRMKAATLTGYRLTTRERGAAQQQLTADDLELRGHVTLYMKSFSGCLQGAVCLSFSPESLPAPPVVPPFIYMTDVEAEQALVTTDSITARELAIKTGNGMRSDKTGNGTRSETGGKNLPDGSHKPETDASPPENEGSGPGSDAPQQPSDPSAPGLPTITEPRREPGDVPWCEKVTLTITNTGGKPMTEGRIVFVSRIVGALGVPWVKETSRHELPLPIASGDSATKTWKVCVDKKHKWKFLLGRHLEHEVTMQYRGRELKTVDIPYP